MMAIQRTGQGHKGHAANFMGSPETTGRAMGRPVKTLRGFKSAGRVGGDGFISFHHLTSPRFKSGALDRGLKRAVGPP
jgi:hypothetical protein